MPIVCLSPGYVVPPICNRRGLLHWSFVYIQEISVTDIHIDCCPTCYYLSVRLVVATREGKSVWNFWLLYTFAYVMSSSYLDTCSIPNCTWGSVPALHTAAVFAINADASRVNELSRRPFPGGLGIRSIPGYPLLQKEEALR